MPRVLRLGGLLALSALLGSCALQPGPAAGPAGEVPEARPGVRKGRSGLSERTEFYAIHTRAGSESSLRTMASTAS